MGVDIEDYLKDFELEEDKLIQLIENHTKKSCRYMSNKICFGDEEQCKNFLQRLNMWDNKDKKISKKHNILLYKFNESINHIIKNPQPEQKYIDYLCEMIY
jgi:hypothetical protein